MLHQFALHILRAMAKEEEEENQRKLLASQDSNSSGNTSVSPSTTPTQSLLSSPALKELARELNLLIKQEEQALKHEQAKRKSLVPIQGRSNSNDSSGNRTRSNTLIELQGGAVSAVSGDRDASNQQNDTISSMHQTSIKN